MTTAEIEVAPEEEAWWEESKLMATVTMLEVSRDLRLPAYWLRHERHRIVTWHIYGWMTDEEYVAVTHGDGVPANWSPR